MKIKKRWGFLTLVALVVVVAVASGVTPAYLANAPQVATGIGARLACSMHFVMGQNKEQVAHDIELYSPMLGLLHYELDDEKKTASASLGFITRTASFKENLGCDLDYPEASVREGLQVAKLQALDAPWPLGNRVETLNPALNTKLAALLQADNAQGLDTRALLIVHHGEVVAEAYAEGYNENTLFLGWSMVKSVTALLAGQLEMEGRLHTQETSLFPAWQDERRNISIENLLQMTDGLAYDEIYSPGQSAPAMLFQSASAAAYMEALPLAWPVGEHYRYSSGSTNLVMQLVQARLGKTPNDSIAQIQQRFFAPMGFAPSLFETDSAGLLMGSSYLYAPARVWAKLGQFMLNNGEINGERLVSEDFIRRSLEPNSSTNEQEFGYNWWLNTNSEKPRWPSLSPNVFAAKGSREQRVMVLPEQDMVIVRLGWSKTKYPDDKNVVEILSWFEEQ